MSATGNNIELTSVDAERVGFKRHLVLPGLILTIAELVFVVAPLLSFFRSLVADTSVLVRIAVPVLVGAQLTWTVAMWSWMRPLYLAIQQKRRGERLSDSLALTAYRSTYSIPLRALFLRSALWLVVAASHGLFLHRYEGWEPHTVVELCASAVFLSFATNVGRLIWYRVILSRLRARVFSGVSPIRQFADGYASQLNQVSLVVSTGTVASLAAFIYFFLPVSDTDYLRIQIYFPIMVVVSTAVLVLYAQRARRVIADYVESEVARSGGSAREGTSADSLATAVYRRAQALPYSLTLVHLFLWVVVGVGAGWLIRIVINLELDDAVLVFGAIVVIAVGACLYQGLWHRETMRPLLEHLTVRHRLPVRGIRTSFSLRAKLLLSFGGMVLFAVGLALFWGFLQYKSLVTDFTVKQADLGLAWLRSEVQGAAVARSEPPSPEFVRQVLNGLDSRQSDSSAVFYYLSAREHEREVKVGGGPMGAPDLPWYARIQLQLADDELVSLRAHSLTGRTGRLVVTWGGEQYQLGNVAVFYPSYRGRGPSLVRPLKELIIFFVVLFGACAGIVVLTVGQFVKPIRRLEKRADGMARGELVKPVSSGGEGDEVGRLTFALEEMRRALREKLRSTEEVNLDLERAVQRRTADLAKKNRELAETLEKLTRAQDQLVRAEKMASIGQLVAGIAHEINNPVNAIVNTVGPLEAAVEEINSADMAVRSEAANDVRDMLSVVQRGAQRTKAIVQALHNYSRTDDENVVDVDLNRSLDDSLELLRHLLKHSIRVERNYSDVGRIRGHAGQLNQVFMNLLTNAAQAVAGHEGATVMVATRARDDSVEVEIRDNGDGIPAEVLPRIFDPFFTTKDVGEGSGLGLSIVHGIVERHGGTIEVDSKPGSGTSFVVLLPRSGEVLAQRRPTHVD